MYVTLKTYLGMFSLTLYSTKISHELTLTWISIYLFTSLFLSERRLHQSCVYNEQCSHRDLNSFCNHTRQRGRVGDTTETSAAAAIEARCLCKFGFHSTSDIHSAEFGAKVCLIGETTIICVRTILGLTWRPQSWWGLFYFPFCITYQTGPIGATAHLRNAFW